MQMGDIMTGRFKFAAPLLAMLAIFCALAIPRAANAAVIADAKADFSSTQGTNGWYYGYVEPSTSADFNQLATYSSVSFVGGDPMGWHEQEPYYSNPGVWTTAYLANDTLYIAPNGVNGNFGRSTIEQWVVVRWISTVTGNVNLAGAFGSPLGQGGNFADALIQQNGATLFQTGPGSTLSTYSFNLDRAVEIGDMIDFIVKPTNPDTNDSVPLAALISTDSVPEPASWAMMLGGFVLVGGSLRRANPARRPARA